MDRGRARLPAPSSGPRCRRPGRCAYCGAADRPCSGLRAADLAGGRYTLDNVAPACRSCNASKCNDEVTGWLRRTARRARLPGFMRPPRDHGRARLARERAAGASRAAVPERVSVLPRSPDRRPAVPSGGGAALAQVAVLDRLTLLPVIVIVVTGVLLVLLMRGG